MFAKIKKFFSEVIVELKKVSWSTKQDLLDSTWIVVVSATFLGIFIWLTDTLLGYLLGIVI
jgi:preprotein translocase subunit SecE